MPDAAARRAAALCLALLAAPAGAQEAAADGEAAAEPGLARMLDDDQAPAYRAVGRLNIAGRRFCTATLVGEREVITAAHCLYNPRTGKRVPLRELRFVAGLRRGEHAAARRIDAAAILEDFVLDEGLELEGVRADVALLALAAPVPADAALPLSVGGGPDAGATVDIVSYARERPYAPSIQEDCSVAAVFGGVAAISCAVGFGASGAPVLAESEVVAVVSAVGRLAAGDGVALAVSLSSRLEELRASLYAPVEGDEPGISQ